MHFLPNEMYHVYNRGNDRRVIFPQPRNYDFFLGKLVKHVASHIHIVAYCLMPNHFHLLLHTPNPYKHDRFSQGLKTMLSSYTRALQRQEGFTGNLFQQNTQAKNLELDPWGTYPMVCFQYIHQNPVSAHLVSSPERWPWSSYAAYASGRAPAWLSTQVAYDDLGIAEHPQVFQKMAWQGLDAELLNRIW